MILTGCFAQVASVICLQKMNLSLKVEILSRMLVRDTDFVSYWKNERIENLFFKVMILLRMFAHDTVCVCLER